MIDRTLLVHSVEVYAPLAMNADRVVEWGEPTELSSVRVTVTERTILGESGAVKSDEMTLWYDTQFSEPKGFIPEEGQKVVWEEKEYFIQAVHPAYGTDRAVQFYRAVLA